MSTTDWARSVKADLVKFQKSYGIPALWAAAQFCHESASDHSSGLSELARNANNYAGLKWADWQKAYGCEPVSFETWEVLNGENVNLSAAFCKCPSWDVWLKVYGDLLSGNYYKPALAYSADPFLFGFKVWSLGWATDPNYMVGIGKWMTELYADYQDTLPAEQVAAAQLPVTIQDADGKRICDGWLENDSTVVPLRQLAEGLGMNVTWNDSRNSVTLGPRQNP